MSNLIIKNVPNTITCCNLISGALATMYAFQSNFSLALIFICIGALFDFFDGFSARFLHVSSPIGKELDSLADVITFGLAPATMLFSFFTGMEACQLGISTYLPYTAFLVAAFSALRLAKFNLDTRQTTSFIGLPTPANALFWGAYIITLQDYSWTTPCMTWTTLLLTLLSCWLLISEVPMFALKFKSFSFANNKLRYSFILCSVALISLFLLIQQSIAGIGLSIVLYIVLSIIKRK